MAGTLTITTLFILAVTLTLSVVDARQMSMDVAVKALHALREPFRVHQQELYVTPSIGISTYPEHAARGRRACGGCVRR